jgi:hypothetical protein
MPSTPTTRLRLERQGLGENLNVWGETKLNDALERIDEAIAGVETVAIAGAATVLTSTNYATDQSRKASLVLTGTLTANSTVTVPGVQKLYLIVNNTTPAGFTLTLKTAAGTGYALRGGPQWVYCNGTDVFRATPRLDQMPAPTAAVDLGGQKLTTLGAPTVGTDAATKTYVDAADSATATAVAASASAAAGSASAASGSASAAATSAANAAASEAAAAGSASAAAGSASSASTSAATAVAAAASISGGPVTSVNGQTGIVNLTAANVGAAATSHSHAVADVTGLQTALDGKAALASAQTFAGAQRGGITALTDGATITPDASANNYFSVTLGGNRTLANPTNLVAGQGGSIIITQDGTGSRTLSYGTAWDFAGGTAPTLTTTAGAVDRLDYFVVSGTSIHAALSKDVK